MLKINASYMHIHVQFRKDKIIGECTSLFVVSNHACLRLTNLTTTSSPPPQFVCLSLILLAEGESLGTRLEWTILHWVFGTINYLHLYNLYIHMTQLDLLQNISHIEMHNYIIVYW